MAPAACTLQQQRLERSVTVVAEMGSKHRGCASAAWYSYLTPDKRGATAERAVCPNVCAPTVMAVAGTQDYRQETAANLVQAVVLG